MEMTLICSGKREHLNRGSQIYTVEFTNPEDLEDGILDATFHVETSNPEIAARYEINESYTFQVPG
jgi:hypothetical protein